MYTPMYIPMYIHYFYGHTDLTRPLCAEPNTYIRKETINISKLIQSILQT